MDWDDLRYFVTLARTGKLTVAARQLGCEHSTVSRRILALEKALGTTLFERRQTGYFPTQHAEDLLIIAEAIEGQVQRIPSAIGGADFDVAGSVRIGAPDGFGSYFLAPRIAAHRARYRNLEIQIVAMPRLFSLSKREADIAISLSQPTSGRLHARKLADYDLGLYAARGYLDQHAPIDHPSHLPGHEFIGYIEDLIFAPELDYLPQIMPDVRPMATSSNLIAQMRAAAAGGGLCVLPKFMAMNEPALVRVLPDAIRLRRSYWLIMHSDTRDLARIRVTADFIVQEIASATKDFVF